jgi:hypothetical protein
MANITYTRGFTHDDWIDNEDVVQAGGERGFNTKFHSLESEFDKIGQVVGVIDTEIKKVQRLNFVQSQPPVTLGPGTASTEFQVELYDRTGLPANVEKVYFAAVFPVSGSTNIRHTFLYRQAPGNKIGVTVQFFNQDAAQPAQFSFRVMTLATQP